MMTKLTVAAGLAAIAIAALATPASARWGADGRWHDDNRWNNWNDRYYGYNYRPPPVVWGTPYNYGYYSPPVVYDSSPSFTFTIRP
jgi:hypothetical protein